MSNKYFFRANISDDKFVNNIFSKLRKRIAEICEAESQFEKGEIELDESYFGSRRVRGIRGRGSKGKTPVFGMLKRGDKVYTQIVKSCSIKELLPIIQGRDDANSVMYTDRRTRKLTRDSH